MSIDEIEAAIQKLPKEEVRELAARLQSRLDEMWDQQIESDQQLGKLDAFMTKAEKDIATSRVWDLDEILHDT